MAIESDIRTVLVGISGLTALVGTRIRTLRLHQSDTLPAVIMTVDTEDERNDLTGISGITYAGVTIESRAATLAGARAVDDAVSGMLKGYSGTFEAYRESVSQSFYPHPEGSDDGFYSIFSHYTVSY